MSKANLKMLYTLIFAVSLISAASMAEEVAATASIKFKGSSTLHDFEGAASTHPFIATFSQDGETGQIKATAKAELSVADMTTNNKKRDSNMFKMLDLTHFEIIKGELVETMIPVDGSAETTLHLKICNVEHDVTATISNFQQDGDHVCCTIVFPLSLKAFNLKSPSVMGIIRVDDAVQVECTVEGQLTKPIAKR